MTISARRMLVFACLAALALPVAASAGSGAVTPPGGGDVQATAAVRAAASPGCRSANAIEFRDRTVIPLLERYAVRHTGRIRCEVRTRIRCRATLYRGKKRLSKVGSRGRNRCEFASRYSQSDYPPGTRFRQRYRYKITLVRERQRWSGTSKFCPKLSNKRRTLTCRDSHSTTAPRRRVDRHS